MKFSTIMAVAAVSIAFLAAGCKYDKAANGSADGDGSAIADGSVTDIDASDLSSADEGMNINDVAGEQKFEDMYAKCTDVDFAPVYFGFDSTVIPAGELGKAEAVAQHLKDKPARVVVIEGNCDERGSNEYNLVLGESRATILRNYLVQNDISANRIQTRSYGEEKPAAEGHDESAWAKNRRGEFGIYDTTQKK